MAGEGPLIFAIALMAMAAFATRIAGPLLMAQVRTTPRSERFLEGLAASVVAALVASLLVQGDLRDVVSVAVAALVMLATRSVIWSMLAGMACAAGMFQLGVF